MKRYFWFENVSASGGKKRERKHEILAFKSLLEEIRLKKVAIRKIFWSSNITALQDRKYKLQKWSEIELYLSPYGFYKKSSTDPSKG